MSLRSLSQLCLATALCSAALFLGACGGGTNPAAGPDTTLPALTDNPIEFSLAAGMTEITPNMNGTVSPSVDLGRFGINGVDRVYEVTTPIGKDFSFTLVARNPGNSGDTRISVGHGADGGATPAGGAETIAGAGMVVEGPGVSYNTNWVDASGDGFARVTVTGAVDRDQILVVRVPQPDDKVEVVAICVEIGDESAINQEEIVTTAAAPLSDEVIFSSDAYQFGLPAIGVNGDRYSIATYDGNSADEWDWMRTRRWLQYDTNTSMTTGGQALAATNDFGSWRDQEVAGQENVLAIASVGNGGVLLDISLDRGASFPISQMLSTDDSGWGQRLVNVAISDDYRIGVIFWQSSGSDFSNLRTKLKLIEGVPSGFDGNNTPTGYTFSAPVTLRDPHAQVTPLLMQLEYSSAGDLVIGYGYSTVAFSASGPFATTTASFRATTRMAGSTTFNDVLIDEEVGVMPMDPSVALLGSGATMQIFFAYERTDGVYLAHSSNGGASFAQVTKTGASGAFMPSVHVRDQAGNTRVDLLYLNPSAKGLELHNLHWDNFATDGSGAVLEALTTATRSESQDNTGANLWLPYSKTVEIHDVAWFGFDAVTNGDDVAIVVHEQDRTSFDFMNLGRPVPNSVFFGGEIFGDANSPQAGGAAAPAVLLPGLTDTVPAPNAAHRNQLRLIVID